MSRWPEGDLVGEFAELMNPRPLPREHRDLLQQMYFRTREMQGLPREEAPPQPSVEEQLIGELARMMMGTAGNLATTLPQHHLQGQRDEANRAHETSLAHLSNQWRENAADAQRMHETSLANQRDATERYVVDKQVASRQQREKQPSNQLEQAYAEIESMVPGLGVAAREQRLSLAEVQQLDPETPYGQSKISALRYAHNRSIGRKPLALREADTALPIEPTPKWGQQFMDAKRMRPRRPDPFELNGPDPFKLNG